MRSAKRKGEHIDDLQWVKTFAIKLNLWGFIIISKMVKIYLKSEI